MPKGLSSEEIIAQSRIESDSDFLEGGATGMSDPGIDRERLQLTDDQVAALKAHEAVLNELDEKAKTLPEKSDPQVIAKLQQELFSPDTEQLKVEEAAKALHDQAKMLFLELNALLESWLADPNHEHEAQQLKQLLSDYWKKLDAATRNSAAHPLMSQGVRQERQNSYVHVLQQTVAGFEKIKDQLTHFGHRKINVQETKQSKDIGQLFGEAQSLFADITALVVKRRLAEKAGGPTSTELGETSLSEQEAQNNWRMLTEDFHHYNELAEMASVADRDKFLTTINFVIARFETIIKRLETTPPGKK